MALQWLEFAQEEQQDMWLRVADPARADQWTKSWPKYQAQMLVQVGKRNPSEALEALGDQDFHWHWKLISIDFREKKRKRAYIMCSEVMLKICGHWRSALSSTKTLISPTVLFILPWWLLKLPWVTITHFPTRWLLESPFMTCFCATVKGAFKSGDSVAKTRGELKNSTFAGDTST